MFKEIRWWYRKRRMHKKIHKHFVSRYHMKLVSHYTQIPYKIMTGTKAGKLIGGQLTTSLYNQLNYEQIRKDFVEMNRKAFDKWFGEQDNNSINKST